MAMLFGTWAQWLLATTLLFRKRAGSKRSIAEHLRRSASHVQLTKCLGLVELTFLGLGSIVGAGIFVLSGVAAHSLAGPAVVLSYLLAALAALLAALSYAEFVVDLPVAGGAFNYVHTTFGELAAWSVAWNMVLEITLSSAAVARGFTSYLSALLGWRAGALRLSAGPLEIDPPAALLVLGLTALLVVGTKQSSAFNIAVSSANLLAIGFVLAAGFPQAEPANLQPFAPYGARGVFSAASVVFFAYIGFDYIASAAEEASNPTRDLPLSIVASLAVATLLYALMGTSIVLMVPYGAIDIDAPFASAFVHHGMAWAAKVVSLGALTGIVTSTLTGLLSQARLLVVLGREGLLPEPLATVSAHTGTPVRATLVAGAAAAALALLVDIGVLAEMVSIGTLYVFFAVCAGVISRRYQDPSKPFSGRLAVALGGIVVASLGSSLSFAFRAPWWAAVAFAALWLACTFSLRLLSVVYTPSKFQVPLFPWTPSLGVLLTLYLICSLGWQAYARFGLWCAAGLAVYLAYGIHAAERKDHLDRELSRLRFESQVEGSDSEGELELPEIHSLQCEGPVDSPHSPPDDPYSPTSSQRPLTAGMLYSDSYAGGK